MTRSTKLLIGIIIVVIITAVGAFLIFLSPETVKESVPHERTILIASGTYYISAGNAEKFSFSVPYGASNIRVKLNFRVKGGSGNDIKVKIIDSTGHVIYNSGQISATSTTIRLPEGGTYELILDNTFSFVSSKEVTLSARVCYIS
ncbi:emp24/gp25L/p24 family protein [Thermococcus gammatolerans]|uniref:GOLD domain-containing protein n=1 Tax=Thermococcus gammatolerans (strain DSM 15229 / JCM 11827 / EJ3) TaxID=593117 RepID=C5A2J8_THEGJ|nr:emp24/gp25L/p24 family protein [Thermococcus gammatolerans]ACS34617.1 Hypothetical protein TGAM_2115 [Thermococcus gammatolerans EJ3]